MSEYRLVLPKTQQGGFAESPQQDIGNSGSPALNQPLTVRNGIGIGVAAMYGKKVVGAGYQAAVSQMGNARLEEGITLGTKAFGYLALGLATGGVGIPLLAAGAEVATVAITMAVENHAISLVNDRLVATRGTRINLNAGGYYG